eukprot:scaffold11460_cov64-Phaeocystis_antarctica.AAC.3
MALSLEPKAGLEAAAALGLCGRANIRFAHALRCCRCCHYCCCCRTVGPEESGDAERRLQRCCEVPKTV